MHPVVTSSAAWGATASEKQTGHELPARGPITI